MQDQPMPQRPGLNRFWWIVLGFLVLWNIWLAWPSGPAQVTIPYSTFMAQVVANNVTAVQIAGDQITGEFAQPVAWPPAAATPGANPTAQSTAAAQGTPAAQSTSAPQSTAVSAANSAANSSQSTYLLFNTTFPATVGDPTLISVLETHQVLVDVTAPPTPWFSILLTDGLPILLLIGVMVWMGRRAAQSQKGIFSFGRTQSRVQVSEHPDVTFADVAGADEAKMELQEVIDFLRNPGKYHDLGARIPRGVLLVGNPGTGKTLLARAVAGEAKVPFFNISASEFVEMFVGVGASRVRDLFKQAKEDAPAIIFIDELDAVGRRRGAGLGTVNDEREQTLNQLLVEMDGFDEHHEVIIMAATNRPDVLDPALLRPGRFDREITVGLPDQKGREGILRIHTRQLRLSVDVDLGLIARATTGFSGADLANLCNEAALTAARHGHDRVAVTDFEEAQDRILLGEARPLLLTNEDRHTVAYHESGHALVAWLLPDADPVHKVTIIPHGRALGVTAQMPDQERYNYSLAYLEARLAVMLGGRSAEEIALGVITTGAENDLIEATRLARRMVTRWGMSDLGLVAFDTDEEQPFLGYELTQGRNYSETTAARIDQAVEDLLADRHELVRNLLANNHDKLDALAQTLLQKETIEETELMDVLGPRPTPAPAEATAQPA